MSEWAEVGLEELGSLSSGKSIKPGGEGQYMVFGSNGVIGGSNEYRHSQGVIIGRVGAYCGSLEVSDRPFWASDNTIVFEPSNSSDLRFTYYLLKQANLNRHAGGSAQPLLTQKSIKGLIFRIPDEETRWRISQTLGSMDDLIENNRRRIEILEEMAQAIYREWFVHFRFPGHETATFIDSPLGPIPEDWSVKAVGDLAQIDKGLSYKGAFLTDDGVPMANLKCIRAEGGFRRDGTKPYSGTFKSKHQVVPGDIVMANTDLTQAGGVIGASAIVPLEGFTNGGIISHHLFAVRPIDQDHRSWLLQVFNDRFFRDFARGVASGTTVLGLRSHDVEQYEVVCPSPAIASKFVQMSSQRESLTEQLHHQVELLEAIRDRLLPKLVSGEINVSDLDALIGAAS